MRSRSFSLLLFLSCVACSQAAPTLLSSGSAGNFASGDTVTMSGGPASIIARDSLTTLDGNVLPCCTTDSAGVHVQVTGGTLTLYEATTYAEMMNSPDGPMPVACVQGVPNGSLLARNNLLTLLDGENYLLPPCTAGYFNVTLTQQLSYPDGSSALRQVTMSSGTYGWQPDLLSLTELGTSNGATASMSGATIAIQIPGHQYSFMAVPSR